MSSKLLIPGAVATVGLLAVLVPFVTETLDVLKVNYDWSPHDPHIAQLAPKCSLQHPQELFGCEDMHLVGDSIFTACLSDYRNRNKVFRRPEPFTEGEGVVSGDKIFRWDLKDDRVVELELRGFPGGATGDDRAFHGLDVNVLADGTLSIYIINQFFPFPVIEKFTHDPSTSYLTHVARIPTNTTRDAAVVPNDIFAVPELDADNAIYVTNVCHYTPHTPLQQFEQFTRRPWGWVSYYSESTGWKKVFTGTVSTNGVTGEKQPPNDRRRRIYVSENMGNSIRVVEEPEKRGEMLKEIQKIPLRFTPDNPSLSNWDLYIAGVARVMPLLGHMVNPFGPWEEEVKGEKKGPGSFVERVNTQQLGGGFFGGGYTADPVVEDIMVDGYGALINTSTTAVFRPYVLESKEEDKEEEDGEEVPQAVKGDLFVTGLTSRGILKCVDMS